MNFQPFDSTTDLHVDQSQLELLEQKMHQGDSAALATLFEIHRSRLKRIVSVRLDRRLAGRIDALDVLQEAFVDMANRLERLRQNSQTYSSFVWMRLVTTECLLNLHRRHLNAEKRDVRREQNNVRDPMNDDTSICLAENIMDRVSSQGQKLVREEMKTTLLTAIADLEMVDQEIITMRCFEGLSNVESAEVLGLSQNGASNRYVRAMSRLRSILKKFPGFFE